MRIREINARAERKQIAFSSNTCADLEALALTQALVRRALAEAIECTQMPDGQTHVFIEIDDVAYVVEARETYGGDAEYVRAIKPHPKKKGITP